MMNQVKILRVSRRGRSKKCQSNRKDPCLSNTSVSLSIVQSNPSRRMINSKQQKINDEGHEDPISIQTKKEINQSKLVDRPRVFLPLDSIKHSTTYFHRFCTDRSFNRNHRITPVHSQDLFRNDLTWDDNHRNRKKKKRKINLTLWKIGLCALVALLLIGGLIGLLVYFLTRLQSSQITTVIKTTSSLITTTTTQNSACVTGSTNCPTPMFLRNRTNNCLKPASSYLYYSCCYQAVSNQLTIEFILREDMSNWYIDDVSIKQGNNELLINGGFESNLTGWIVSSGISNLSVTPLAMYSPGAAHTGSVYLYSEAKYASDRIKQTVNVIQGQNVNISFWWLDDGGVPGSLELCEAVVTLTP